MLSVMTSEGGGGRVSGSVGRWDCLASVGLAAVGLVVFAASLDFRTSGDSLVYADTIAKARFDYVAVHFGYYVLIWPVHRLVNLFAPLPVEDVLVYANAVFGAASLFVGFWLARRVLEGTAAAACAMTVLMFSGRYFANATSAEMYAPQMFFLLLSFLLFVHDRPVASGLAAVLSLLITPLSAFCLLVFPVLARLTPSGAVRRLVICAVSVAIAYGLFLAFMHDALFWGERGLLRIAGSVPYEFAVGGANLVSNTVKFFLPFLPLAALGLAALRGRPELLWLLAAAYLPHMYLVFKQPRADQLLFPTDFFLACLCGAGAVAAARVPRVGRYVAVALVGGTVVASVYLLEAFTGPRNTRYGSDMRALSRHLVDRPGAIVVMSWWDGIALRYYGADPESRDLDRPGIPVYDAGLLDRVPRPVLPAHSELFVLESYEPSRVAALVLGQSRLGRRYEATSVRRRVERGLRVRCVPEPAGALELYDCR